MMRGLGAALAAVLGVAAAHAYPLDGFDSTGIARLEAFYRAREALLQRGTLVPGSFLNLDQVGLRLQEQPGFATPASDPDLSKQIAGLLGADAGGYGIAVLDITDPVAPRYVEHNGTMPQNPGSVGKVVVALAFFQALADREPDVEARKALLVNTMLAANDFIKNDHHVVPWYRPGDPTVKRRPLEIGDEGNLYTWLDWMCSASSNAAAGMLQAQLILMKHFGAEWPVSAEKAAAFFANTPKAELVKIYSDAIQSPLRRNGLSNKGLRQGAFFTREGKNRVPATHGSTANARELMKYIVLMEQGKLVDPWSSLEIKRLLYLTDIRIRYASSSALDDSAVYYKSGSLYGCKEEEGFECGKYIGNRINYMNSLAIVESAGDGPSLRYVVVLLSNVLRKNSADKHQKLATEIQELIQGFHTGGAAEATTSEK